MKGVLTWLTLTVALVLGRCISSYLNWGGFETGHEFWLALIVVPMVQLPALWLSSRWLLGPTLWRSLLAGFRSFHYTSALLLGDGVLIVMVLVSFWYEPLDGWGARLMGYYLPLKAVCYGGVLLFRSAKEGPGPRVWAMRSLGVFWVLFAIEFVTAILPNRYIYLVGIGLAVVFLFLLLSEREGNCQKVRPAVYAGGLLLLLATLIAGVSFFKSVEISQGWAEVTLWSCSFGLSFLWFGMFASFADPDQLCGKGRFFSNHRLFQAGMVLCLSYWITSVTLSVLGLNQIDLRQIVVVQALVVPVGQTLLLWWMVSGNSPVGISSIIWRRLAKRPLALTLLGVDLGVLILARLLSSQAVILSPSAVVFVLYVVSRGLLIAVAGFLWASRVKRKWRGRMYAFSFLMFCYSVNHIYPWLDSLRSSLLPQLPSLYQWIIVCVVVFPLAMWILMLLAEVWNEFWKPAGSVIGLAQFFSLLPAIVVVSVFYNVPYLPAFWSNVVSVCFYLTVSCIWLSVILVFPLVGKVNPSEGLKLKP